MRKYSILKSIFPTASLVGIISAHILFLSRIVFWPYAELFIYSYLTSIGSIPYKQIFDQHFPGLMFFPVNLYSIGITSPLEMRILQFVVIALVHIMLFLIAKKIFRKTSLGLLVNILYLLVQPFYEGYAVWIETFIPLFLLPAFYFVWIYSQKDKTVNIFLAGVFFGLSFIFKQTVLPLIILVVLFLYLIKKKVKPIIYLFLGMVLSTLPLILFVLKNNIITDFWYWTVTFNLTIFNKMGRTYPDINGLVKIAPLFVLPLFISLYLMLVKKDLVNRILFVFLVGTLFFAYARFDFIHFQPALPFALFVIVNSLKYIENKYRIIYLGGFFLTSILIFAFTFLNFKGNNVLFFGETERITSEKVLTYVKKGDTIFALGTQPHIYYLTQTRPPGGVFVFQFPWFMLITEDRILREMINDTPKVVIRDKDSSVNGSNLLNYMQKINTFINENYIIADSVNNIEILVKK